MHFIFGLFDWRFFAILLSLICLGVYLPARYLKPFRSVKFNVYLFLVIAALSSIGTFIPQNKSAADALKKVGPFWADVFQKFGFLDIYHSWYFAGLLALMAFDVIACKLQNLPRLMHGKIKNKQGDEAELSVDHFAHSRHRAQLNASGPVGDTSDAVRSWLTAKKIKFHEGRGANGGRAFYAGRHRIQRWGDFILHISIVGVLAGNLLGALRGFEEILPIEEGATVTMKNRPYDVTLNDFDIEYYKSTGAPSLYASDLSVSEKGRLVARKKVIVNDPLDIDRVRFYQASWGMTDQFRTAKLHMAGSVLELKPGEIRPIAQTPYSVRANMFLPTFDIDANGRAITQNYEGKNPAVQIDFLEKGAVKLKLWLVKERSDLAFQVVNDRLIEAKQPPPFFLVDVDPLLFSGIQIGYDPGAPVFWFFAVILMIGLCMHFYLHQRRLRILVEPAGSGSRVHVGGWNSRTPEDFSKQFDQWVAHLGQALRR